MAEGGLLSPQADQAQMPTEEEGECHVPPTTSAATVPPSPPGISVSAFPLAPCLPEPGKTHAHLGTHDLSFGLDGSASPSKLQRHIL